jgi:hypothetical protein
MSCLIFLLDHIVLVTVLMARRCRWFLCVMNTFLGRVCVFNIAYVIWISGRSQWPRGLRPKATRLLGLWVRIQRGHECECCVLSGRGLCVGLITRPEESCRVWYDCDREASIMRRPWPSRDCCAMGEKCPVISAAVEFREFYTAIISALCTFMPLYFGCTSRLA